MVFHSGSHESSSICLPMNSHPGKENGIHWEQLKTFILLHLVQPILFIWLADCFLTKKTAWITHSATLGNGPCCLHALSLVVKNCSEIFLCVSMVCIVLMCIHKDSNFCCCLRSAKTEQFGKVSSKQHFNLVDHFKLRSSRIYFQRISWYLIGVVCQL